MKKTLKSDRSIGIGTIPLLRSDRCSHLAHPLQLHSMKNPCVRFNLTLLMNKDIWGGRRQGERLRQSYLCDMVPDAWNSR